MAQDLKAFFQAQATDKGVFADYLARVAYNEDGLLRYQSIAQFGNKRGQTLYNHILNGICLLATLQKPLALEALHLRVLMTAFSVHDLNKTHADEHPQAFTQLATEQNVAAEIARLGLERFFEHWSDYLPDITTLVRAHSAHYHAAGEMLLPLRTPRYGLGMQTVTELAHLMTAVDVLDLSKSLTEQKHKRKFLSELNAYGARTGRQFSLHQHRLTESRALLTNIMHNAIAGELTAASETQVLALYPDGVLYLMPKGREWPDTAQLLPRLTQAVERGINAVQFGDVADLIEMTGQGIKIKPDVFVTRPAFADVWSAVYNQIPAFPRSKLDKLEAKARERTLAKLEGNRDAAAQQLYARLTDPTPLFTATEAQYRSAELLRTYVIFLKTHGKQFSATLPKGKDWHWHYVLSLVDMPDRADYAFFDANYDRPYYVAADITSNEDDVYDRIVADGERLFATLPENTQDSPWSQYLEQSLLIDEHPLTPASWVAYTEHYQQNQHQQCVTCGSNFPTAKWKSADLRDALKVQAFSNRLLGGGKTEPTKRVCQVCRVQHLLDKIAYPKLRGGEDAYYLHIYPYSFFPAAYADGLGYAFRQLVQQDDGLGALNLNNRDAVKQMRDIGTIKPQFRDRTAKDKSQPYGVFVPQFSQALAGSMSLPLAPAGENESERFLFALWYALVLSRYLGVRVLLSREQVPPLTPDDMPDVYVDNIPVGCEGLLPTAGYASYPDEAPYKDQPQVSSLSDLWQRAIHLFELLGVLPRAERDPLPVLVRALSRGPLHLYHYVDRQFEKEDEQWRYNKAFAPLYTLTQQVGGRFMQQLSDHIATLAAHAHANRLRGRSFVRNSLLYPLDQVLKRMALAGGHADREALIAATVEDIFAHLERIADDNYRPGLTKYGHIDTFVRGWWDGVLDQAYEGNLQRLLTDEKLLRSAYLFYYRAADAKARAARNADTQPDDTQTEATETNEE